LEPNPHDTLPHPIGAPPALPPRASGRFLYGEGQRPLDGYTIRRGVGQGGFGEIFPATSDAGKEVALKLIRRNLDVELRGIRQCLNFRHPHLLDLYDIRQDGHGDVWVVMEFIAGKSLEGVLAARPGGLPIHEALAWIHGIGQGVAYLHDRGVVHRDLKPGNIFCDEGVGKVGDYGLSKFISCNRRSGHTESIGTVHYMAPEVAGGRYGREIDVYALGVILYELLTGRVPFEGESVGEVLMKHLTARPDVSMLPEPYRAVVARALEKDPALRYPSAAEMLAALPPPPTDAFLFGSQPSWRPEDARHSTLAADRYGTLLRRERTTAVVQKPPRQRVADLLGSMLLSALAAAAICFAMASSKPERFAWLWAVSALGAWAVLAPSKLWEGKQGDPLARRFTLMLLGMVVGAAAFFLSDWLMLALPSAAGYPRSPSYRLPLGFYAVDGRPLVLAYMASFGALFAMVAWWRQADPLRPASFHVRCSPWKLVVSVFAAGLAAWALHFPQPWLPTIAGAMSASIQLAAPWSPPGKRGAKG